MTHDPWPLCAYILTDASMSDTSLLLKYGWSPPSVAFVRHWIGSQLPQPKVTSDSHFQPQGHKVSLQTKQSHTDDTLFTVFHWSELTRRRYRFVAFQSDISIHNLFRLLTSLLFQVRIISKDKVNVCATLNDEYISVFQLSIVHADKQMLSSFPVWKFAPFSWPLRIWMCIQAK